ncbi:hypothetical protein BH20ACT5_BH20ACT5_02150 [soil metagenome]
MRAFLRLLAALLALVLSVAGALTAIEVVAALLDRGPTLIDYDAWLAELRARSWDDLGVRVSAAGAVVLGLVLLSSGLTRKGRRIPLRSDRADVELSTSRPALSRFLRSRAERVEGVSSAHVKVTRRRATINAQARLHDPEVVEQQLRTSLDQGLATLPWVRRPALRVEVRGGSS